GLRGECVRRARCGAGRAAPVDLVGNDAGIRRWRAIANAGLVVDERCDLGSIPVHDVRSARAAAVRRVAFPFRRLLQEVRCDARPTTSYGRGRTPAALPARIANTGPMAPVACRTSGCTASSSDPGMTGPLARFPGRT